MIHLEYAMTLSLFLLVAGLVLFIVAACGVASGRINLIAAGLACWLAVEILQGFK